MLMILLTTGGSLSKAGMHWISHLGLPLPASSSRGHMKCRFLYSSYISVRFCNVTRTAMQQL